MTSFKSRFCRLMRCCTSNYSLGLLLLVFVPSILAVQFLTGCSTMSAVVKGLTPSGSLPPLNKISLSADKLLNNGAPVAVDLVLVFDKKPLAVLGALRASEWFNNRQDLLRQYPSHLKVTSWEIVPGQMIQPTNVSEDQGKLVAVLIFANYLGERSFRADASSMQNIRVRLSKDDFSISAF
jgi:type VI secretion system protein